MLLEIVPYVIGALGGVSASALFQAKMADPDKSACRRRSRFLLELCLSVLIVGVLAGIVDSTVHKLPYFGGRPPADVSSPY